MTDKELRKLKRSELLEILFYLRKELDELRDENEKLTARLDELTRSSAEAKTELSESCMDELMRKVRRTVEDCLKGESQPVNDHVNRKKKNGQRKNQ